jgi:alpha-methylacyl-CoA racemase
VAPVLSVAEAPHDPHLVARGTFEERDGVVQPAPAPRFIGGSDPVDRPARPPFPGEHSRSAFAAWGIDDIETWITDGAVKEASDA